MGHSLWMHVASVIIPVAMALETVASNYSSPRDTGPVSHLECENKVAKKMFMASFTLLRVSNYLSVAMEAT